jgi:hypothetical protein
MALALHAAEHEAKHESESEYERLLGNVTFEDTNATFHESCETETYPALF